MITLPWLLPLFIAGCTLPGSEDHGPLSGPDSHGPAIVQAATALDERHYEQAKAAFAQLLKVDPQNLQARLGMAEAQLGLGATDTAREAFAGMADQQPVRARALQGLGLANERLGDLEGAEAALDAAVAADETLWLAWSGLARLHDRAQAWDLSAAAYEHALAHAPRREVVLNNWGMSLLAHGEPSEAVKRFEEALRIRPDLATAQANLRLAFAMAGDEDAVLAQASIQERPQVLNNLGYVSLVRGELAQAEAYFQQAIEESPTFYQRAYDNLQRLDLLRQQKGATAPS